MSLSNIRITFEDAATYDQHVAEIKAQALREFADAHRLPWTVFRRADGAPVAVNDLLRETAASIENGGDR